MLARRFSCPPVHEAAYEPRDIPNAARDMSGTVILRPTRDEWLALLGELVQITNEAKRRRASSVRDSSKPLSLEYMADRMDVDDPLFGYLAVTKDKGWLQGYVTCTTFTTWHRDFRWDSLNPILDLTERHDEAHGAGLSSPTTSQRAERAPPLYDADGALSTELQAELRAGDPDNEGVVWPRIAELSLLGALGCGRWLVQLVIDGLECADSPYRYVVAQATESAAPTELSQQIRLAQEKHKRLRRWLSQHLSRFPDARRCGLRLDVQPPAGASRGARGAASRRADRRSACVLWALLRTLHLVGHRERWRHLGLGL